MARMQNAEVLQLEDKMARMIIIGWMAIILWAAKTVRMFVMA